MDSTTKSVIAVTLLILGMLLGTNYMVTDEPQGNWLWWALLLLGGAIFFWLWMQRDERRAEEAARDALDEAERQAKSLENATAQAILDATESAEERVEEALDRAGMEPAEPETPDETDDKTVEQDDIFEEHATPVEDDKGAPAEPEPEPLDDIAETPSGADVLEEAENGSPVAEKQVAEAGAQPATDDSVEITPQDAEEADVENLEAVGQADDTDESEEPDISAAELEREQAQELDNDTHTDADELADEADTDGEPDDLKLIEGIGPAYERYLNAAGINTFAQLATMSEDDIAETIIAQGGRRAASMESWAEQAQLAADGNWDELEQLQDELSGGRR
jgi:predicted flap endonuclease-1-like 5' DNA nuclease